MPTHIFAQIFTIMMSHIKKKPILFTWMLAVAFVAKAQTPGDTVHYAEEKHFKNIQQLTFGGDNAEAYWSYDSKQIIFQRTNAKEGLSCDQMFIGTIPAAGNKFEYKMVSSGKGRTTCGFFLPDGKHIIYASTHLGADTCPPIPDRKNYGNKYIWPLYN